LAPLQDYGASFIYHFIKVRSRSNTTTVPENPSAYIV
jgi:hypothetical protein